MTDGWSVTIRRAFPLIEWEVYHSGYGLAWGYTWTRKRAERKARAAIGDLVTA